MKVLHLDSGLFEGQSVTRQLSKTLVEKLGASEVIYRDLVKTAPAHLTAEIILAAGKAESERSAFEQEQVALTETLLDELFSADVLVISAPMYNFTVPSQLKAWLDRVLQAGKTFRYTESGAEGLVTGKQVYIVSSRGGIYSEGPAAAFEHQESYLKSALGFIGLTDVQVIRAEGVNLGEEPKAKAIDAAKSAIAAL